MHAHPITEQLTDLRRSAGISRSTVAARAGVQWALLRRWEIGEHVPVLSNLMLWAAALDCAVVVQPRVGLPRLGANPVVALAEIRRRRGLSQFGFAADAGLTQSQVSQWEGGRVSPGLRALAGWADALGCELVLVPAVLAAAA